VAGASSLFRSIPPSSWLAGSPASLSASFSSVIVNNNRNLVGTLPTGFSNWVKLVKSRTNKHLHKNKYSPRGLEEWNIVLDFFNGNTKLLSIGYNKSSKQFYINDFSAEKGSQESEIKMQNRSDGKIDYYADCKSRGEKGETFFVFNFDPNTPIIIQSDRGEELYELKYDTSIGYSFEAISYEL
jgi:hypothetical protein